MPHTQTTYYLGTCYQVTHQYDRTSGLLWRNVRISRGGAVIGPCVSDLDLDSLWDTFRPQNYYRAPDEFLFYLRSLVSNPGEVDSLVFCAECRSPVPCVDDMTYIDDVTYICEFCRDEYYNPCDSCGGLYNNDRIVATLDEANVCRSCRSRYYTYCEDCDGYYPDNESDEHDHYSDDGCCESPQPQFTVPNDGAEPLANDTRAAFTLPAGTISSAGIQAIKDYLRRCGLYELYYNLAEIDDQWQTREGNYAKRLSRYAYKAHQIRLSPKVMSQVGCLARDHSNAATMEVEVTRDFNQPAGYFYHEDSCYWGGYSESRCVLKTSGAFALRSFHGGCLSGRAWVLPLRRPPAGQGTTLGPTFATMDADAFAVFNGYGDLGGYAAARIVAHMAGYTYRKIGFSCGPAYINAGGYLVAPEEIAEQYTNGSLHLSVDQHSRLYERELSHA